jgi:hypothetical protein
VLIFDKDLFLGPVGKDGKIVQNPSANAASAATGDGGNVYEALVSNHLTIILVVGRRRYRRIKASVCFATTLLVTVH